MPIQKTMSWIDDNVKIKQEPMKKSKGTPGAGLAEFLSMSSKAQPTPEQEHIYSIGLVEHGVRAGESAFKDLKLDMKTILLNVDAKTKKSLTDSVVHMGAVSVNSRVDPCTMFDSISLRKNILILS
jgi:hypothetical protein